MAIVGLKMVTLALVDPKTQQLLKGEQGLSESGLALGSPPLFVRPLYTLSEGLSIPF